MTQRISIPQPQPVALSGRPMPLAQWVEESTRTLSPKTMESYRSLLHHLRTFFGREPLLSDFTPSLCARLSPHLLQRLHPSSARTYLSKLYALLRRAHRQGLIPFNPGLFPELRLPRLPEQEPSFLSAAQVLSLEQSPCPHESTKRAFLFAVHTGLRLSDIETLQWRHIRSRPGGLMVEKQQVKTKRLVRVPLNSKALALLRQLAGHKPLNTKRPDSPVFSLPSRTTISSDLRAWACNAGLDLRLTFHMSRHTFVTILLQSDIGIYTASRLCGHARVATTERYAHLTDRLLSSATRNVDHFWSRVKRE